MFLPFYDAKVQQLFLADVQFCAVLDNHRLFDAIELRLFMRRGRAARGDSFDRRGLTRGKTLHRRTAHRDECPMHSMSG